MYKHILLLIAFWVMLPHLSAQEHYAFSPIDTNDGLSENHIIGLNQLHDGRMVIITEGLVNLYNGTSVDYLHFNDEHTYILTGYSGYQRSYTGKEGLLWIKNSYKLQVFDIHQEAYISHTDSLLHTQGIRKRLKDFFMDTDYNYWYLTEDDQLIYRNMQEEEPGCRVFLSDVSTPYDEEDQLYDLALCNNQVFLFYKSGLMSCYDLETGKEEYRENPFGEQKNIYDLTLQVVPYAQYIYQIRRKTDSGAVMHRFNTKNRQWEKILDSDTNLNTLTVDKNGDCWVSSEDGIWFVDKYLMNKKHIPQLQLVDGRVFNTVINAQYNDPEGGLWIGTSNRGLLYYHPDRFKFRNFGSTLFHKRSNQDLRVNSFCRNEDQILVATQQGLFRYNAADSHLPGSVQLSRYPDIPDNASCSMIHQDATGRIWIATSNNYGLYSLQNNRLRQYTFPFSAIHYIHESIDGRILLATDNGFGLFDPVTGDYLRIDGETKPALGTVYQLVGHGQNRLMGISSQGLFMYDFSSDSLSISSTDKENKLSMFNQTNHQYNCIYIDTYGLLWVGTQDGLFVWDPEKEMLTAFHTENNLVNNVIKSITEDHHHRIWVSTSNGISCIDRIREENIYQYTFRNFNRNDGVVEYEFMPRSVYQTEDGRLFWGGLDGFNELDYTLLYADSRYLSTPLFIKFFLSGSEVKQGETYNGEVILHQSIASTRELTLKHNQNFIGFDFSALNYVNPTQTFYRFKLEGVDNSWRETKTTDGMGRVNYTNLSPGSYVLKVNAANNSHNWNEEYATMRIIITPPFWKTPTAYLLYLFTFILLTYISVRLIHQRNKRIVDLRQKEELEQLKYRFFTNISHELRTPLTLILTPLDSVIKKITDPKIREQLEGVQRNSNNLLSLVNQLLDFRKLEMKGEDLRLSNCHINEFITSIGNTFEEITSNRGIDLIWNVSPRNLYMYVDQDKLRKIIMNLLSNACKFTSRGGKITLDARLTTDPETSESMLRIQITDTGCGIAEKDLPHLFNRFYQVKHPNDQNTGSGIGLHLAQEYALLHNGQIKVESEVNKGSSFIVYIPANLQPVATRSLNNEEDAEAAHPLKILVVEDNEEFRSFLCNELAESYTVYEASNGVEGLEIALQKLPDLIITDLMMPEMNGLELCNRLKKEIRTSHIPVILLTARASETTQLEGYEAGADAYISKPFNMDILQVRIQHFIEQQEKRKELFKKALIINPESVTTSHIDEQLIKKALSCIEKNMNNPNYSVEQFSKDMCMDRTSLYRKLMAIVEQTPTAFIRTIRLKRATQLLEQGLPVSEVADQVGFGTVSYFSKCFQEEFHVKPSQYKAN